jgi:hypothetical protein
MPLNLLPYLTLKWIRLFNIMKTIVADNKIRTLTASFWYDSKTTYLLGQHCRHNVAYCKTCFQNKNTKFLRFSRLFSLQWYAIHNHLISNNKSTNLVSIGCVQNCCERDFLRPMKSWFIDTKTLWEHSLMGLSRVRPSKTEPKLSRPRLFRESRWLWLLVLIRTWLNPSLVEPQWKQCAGR